MNEEWPSGFSVIKPQTPATNQGAPPPRTFLCCPPQGSSLLRLWDRQLATALPSGEWEFVKLTNSSEGLAAGPVAGAAGGGISWPRKTVKGGNNKRPSWLRCLGWQRWGWGFLLHFLPLFPTLLPVILLGEGGLGGLVQEREADGAWLCSCPPAHWCSSLRV